MVVSVTGGMVVEEVEEGGVVDVEEVVLVVGIVVVGERGVDGTVVVEDEEGTLEVGVGEGIVVEVESETGTEEGGVVEVEEGGWVEEEVDGGMVGGGGGTGAGIVSVVSVGVLSEGVLGFPAVVSSCAASPSWANATDGPTTGKSVPSRARILTNANHRRPPFGLRLANRAWLESSPSGPLASVDIPLSTLCLPRNRFHRSTSTFPFI